LRAIPPKKIEKIAQNMLKPASGMATGVAPSASGNRQKQRKKTGNANLYGFISQYPLPTAYSYPSKTTGSPTAPLVALFSIPALNLHHLITPLWRRKVKKLCLKYFTTATGKPVLPPS
jgi:hypothetical protein